MNNHPSDGPNTCDRCSTTYKYSGSIFCNECHTKWLHRDNDSSVTRFIKEYKSRYSKVDGWF